MKFFNMMMTAAAMTFAAQGVCAELPDFWAPPKQVKLIEFSWNSPDTAYLRKNIEQMEKLTPYQGIGIHVRATGVHNGKKVKCFHRSITGKIPWKYEWFKQAIKDLKNTRFRKFTDNFIRVNTCPGNVDWFSDEDWKTVCNNFSIMSRIAKECGLKGLALDMEMYEYPMMTYPKDATRSLDEYRKKARQRGREFADAVFGPYPDMRFFCFFWLSHTQNFYFRISDPDQYDLAAYFINGIYDNLPPEAMIIDGHEEAGYRASSEMAYMKLRDDVMRKFHMIIDKKNINKVKTQTQLSVAFYLDAYFEQTKQIKGWTESVLPNKKERPLDVFNRNMNYARLYTDDYIWTWGEKGSWWKKENHWETKAPGITAVVKNAIDPEGFVNARYEVAKANGFGKNLLLNPEFAGTVSQNKTVAKWKFWQSAASKGSYGLETGVDGNCIYNKNSARAAFFQSVKVKAGEVYMLRAMAKIEGKDSSATLTVRWKNRAGQWESLILDRTVVFEKPDADGWCRAELKIAVPPSSTALVFMLNSVSVDGKVSFRNPELYKL